MNLTGYQYIENRNDYEIYRKIINGKGRWAAKRPDGYVFRITYNQALGHEPINCDEAMKMMISETMLPR